MTSLRIHRLRKTFDGAHATRDALSDIDLEVAAGELLVLLGPSGSGKTTLLRCIAGLIEPSEGRIMFGDSTVADSAAGINVPPSKRHLGMVFQNFALWPHMTVAENVSYPLKARKWPRSQIGPRVGEMLKLVHCSEFADRLPSTLSGGQQQRIALARALSAKPAMILFDEPLSNLDALLRVELRSQLRLIHRMTNFTGVYVTHDQVEALGLGTRIVVMNGGRIEQIGTPEDVYARPSTPFAAEFMGMLNVVEITLAHGQWSGPSGPVAGQALLPRVGGEKLALHFRPEDVRLSRAADADDPKHRGALTVGRARIIDRAFHGEFVEFILKLGDASLKARVSGDVERLQVDDDALVGVAAEHLAIFENAMRVELESPRGPRIVAV